MSFTGRPRRDLSHSPANLNAPVARPNKKPPAEQTVRLAARPCLLSLQDGPTGPSRTLTHTPRCMARLRACFESVVSGADPPCSERWRGEVTKKAASRTRGSTGGPTMSFLLPPERNIIPDPKAIQLQIMLTTQAGIRQEEIAEIPTNAAEGSSWSRLPLRRAPRSGKNYTWLRTVAGCAPGHLHITR